MASTTNNASAPASAARGPAPTSAVNNSRRRIVSRRNMSRWQRINQINDCASKNEIGQLAGIAKNLVHSRALGWSKMYEELGYAADHYAELNNARRHVERRVIDHEADDNMNIDQLLNEDRNKLIAQNEHLKKVIKDVCSGMREELECKAQCGKVIGSASAAAAEPGEYFSSKNMVIPSCGHIICRPCFNDWSKAKGITAPPCPYCRAPMFGIPQSDSDNSENSDSDDAGNNNSDIVANL